MTEEEIAARKRRNLALAGALILFVVLVFTITVLRLTSNIAASAPINSFPAGQFLVPVPVQVAIPYQHWIKAG